MEVKKSYIRSGVRVYIYIYAPIIFCNEKIKQFGSGCKCTYWGQAEPNFAEGAKHVLGIERET